MSQNLDYIAGLKTDKSRAHFEIAKKVMPGGTSSNARSYPLFDPYYIVMDRGKGSHIWDVDGNEYIDYSLAYGPLILGHCHPRVVDAVKKQVEKLHMSETATELELELALKFNKIVRCAEMVRFGNTGSEENPNKVPGSLGIPKATSETVIILPWNNLDLLERTIKKHAHEIAAVITEPVMNNIGWVPPEEVYLKGIRELTEDNDIVFILDEVVTGFRVALGGAQDLFGITPDMATYAKAMGGGFPISAIAGKREIMEHVRPGEILHGGTYNGNPLVLAASNATIDVLSENNGAVYNQMQKIGETLIRGHQDAINDTHSDALVQGYGPVLQMYFNKLKEIRNYRDYCQTDPALYARYQKEMAKRGIWFGPEVHFFVSAVHTMEDAEKTISAVESSLKSMKEG